MKEGSKAVLLLCVSFVILLCFSCAAPEERPRTHKEVEDQRTDTASETEGKEKAGEERPKEGFPERADIEEVLSSLIRRLGDDEFRTRVEAFKEIKRILRESVYEPRNIRRLLSFLKNCSEKTEDEEVRMRLDSILQFYSSLSEYLSSRCAKVRKKAMSKSDDKKEAFFVELLVEALKDENWNVCLFAARTLSEIDNRLAIRKIIEVLKKADDRSWG